MTSDAQFLNALRSKIKTARDQASRLKGELDANKKSMKDKFNCSTLEAAKRRLAAWDEKHKQLLADSAEKIEAIRNDYDA